MPAPSVFISYSHDSPEHEKRVLELSDRLRTEGVDATIDQYETSPAEGWPKWMDREIEKSNFVIVVCTETYLRRVNGEEEKGKRLGVKWESTLTFQDIYDADSTNSKFIPVLFEDGKTEYIPKPLKGATYYRLPSQYEDLYRRLTNQPKTIKPEIGKLKSLPPRERKLITPEIKISLAKLPSTDSTLFGREEKLKQLDDAWNNQQINVLSLIAWGGVGKSALVNVWLSQMAADNYRGAERVFGWSFYSQGAAEGRQVSADQFIAAALEWFGDEDPNKGSPWDKGERLAELIKQQRTLLILDGLEPLQNPSPVETGRIKDPGLRSLLRELARQNPGMLVITSRLSVDVTPHPTPPLKGREGEGSAIEIDLENLSPKAGAQYLAHLGVDGMDEERREASKDFAGHALALTLMGSYLKVVHHGDIRKRKEIPHVMDEQKQGAHARRVMESYEQWLKGKPELDILRLMGLFDRPAAGGALEALRKEPAIEGLTNALQKLSNADWNYAVNNLRELHLIAQEDPHEPDALDCHPLLREHFGEKLKADNPNAWCEAHSRLYEYYKSIAKEFPDTIEEMAPLYAAVMHGCQAGKHQEALDEVYWKRICRKKEFFNTNKLCAFGAGLATISGFIESPWLKPVDGLIEAAKVLVLGEAGFYLRALGRLVEAVQPMQASLDAGIAQKDWKNSAIHATNLSELYLIIGNVPQSLAYAEQSIQFADRSGDLFQQMTSRATLGNAQHYIGKLSEAEAIFHNAEERYILLKGFPLLSREGFQYCDLLLSKGDIQQVVRRASWSLEKAIQQKFPLDIALNNLSLGCAYLLQSQHEPNHPFTESLNYLNLAVDGLRQAGSQHHIPRGLLARAEFYRITGDFDKAQKDLDEAFTIATRGGMGLHLADCHLEYARLALARPHPNPLPKGEGAEQDDSKEEARQHWEIAKKMIDEMGYHRRDKEVEEIEKQL